MKKIEEIWKDIEVEGIPKGVYQISNIGRVKSLARTIQRKRGKTRLPEKIMKNIKGNGYYRLTLQHEGHISPYSVHRLVAEAFIPNPENKPCVNHKNAIKTDNRISNLEWCTYSENNTHAFKMGLKVGSNRKLHPDTVMKIRALYPYYSCYALAKMFPVNKDAIGKIVNYKTWKYI